MDKLYWIACEEGDKALYEGRFLGRTRGSALKHLKDKLGRSNLIGLVFSVTEIPVPLIREIVIETFEQQRSLTTQEEQADEPEEAPPRPTLFSNPTTRPQYDWEAIKECYMAGRGPKEVSRIMNVPINTLSGRIRREGWAHERREVDA